jgi:hypothetical protein
MCVCTPPEMQAAVVASREKRLLYMERSRRKGSELSKHRVCARNVYVKQNGEIVVHGKQSIVALLEPVLNVHRGARRRHRPEEGSS